MDTKKKVLQKTVSFVTALSFVAASQNQAISIFADETQPSTQPPASETTTVPDSTTAETSQTTEATTTPAEKQITFSININGAKDYKDEYKNIINAVFDKTVTDQISKSNKDNTITLPTSDSLKNHILKEQDKTTLKTLIYIQNIRLKIDSVNDSAITLSEQYQVNTDSQHLNLSCPGLTDGYASYNTEFTVSPKQGWKFIPPDFQPLYTPMTVYTLYGNVYLEDKQINWHDATVVHNGILTKDLLVGKTQYIIDVKPNDKLFKVTGENISDSKIYNDWLYNVNDGYCIRWINVQGQNKNKIGAIELYDSDGNPLEHADTNYTDNLQENKGTSFKIPASYTDGETFSLSVETSPEGVQAQITKKFTDDTSKQETAKFTINNQKNIQIPIYLRNEKNMVEYVLKSYTYNKKPHTVTSEQIISKIGDNDCFIEQKYQGQDSISCEYAQISTVGSSSGVITLDEKCVQFKGNSYIAGMEQWSYYLLSLDAAGDSMLMYDAVTLDDKGKKVNTNGGAVLNSTSPTFAYPKPQNSNPSVLVVSGIINSDTQILPEPIYFYLDTDKPLVGINYDSSLEQSDGWSTKNFNFSLDINDKHSFDADVYGEEINKALDGAGSEITRLKIGTYTFDKTDSGWTQISGDETDGYVVSIDDDFNITVSLGTDADGVPLEGLNETLEITATDACSNVSEAQYCNVRIDQSLPELDAVTLSNLVENLIIPDEVVKNGNDLIVDTSSHDDFSGIKSVRLDYGEEECQGFSKSEYFNDRDNTLTHFTAGKTDKKGELKFTLTDKAGNENIFYYDPASKNSISSDTQAQIIMDNKRPECQISTQTKSTYQDNAGHKWYPEYPVININGKDINPEICSGINKLSITINDITKSIDNLDMASFDAFTITFTPVDTADNITTYTAAINYTDKAGTAQVCEFDKQFNLPRDNGRIYVKAIAEDYALNESFAAEDNYYVDVIAPSSSGIFSVFGNSVNTTGFGTFFNQQATFKTSVIDGWPSSGISKAVLKFNDTEYVYTCNDYKDNTIAEFNIPETVQEQMSLSGSPVIEIFDRTGHSSGDIPLHSEHNSSNIIIENKKPILEDFVLSGEDEYIDPQNRKWFSSDIGITSIVTDEDSGIGQTNISVSGDFHNEKNLINENYQGSDYTSRTLTKEYKVNTNMADYADGRFTFKESVSDNASNPDTKEVTVYKDITKPVITDYKFENDQAQIIQSLSGMPMLPYGYFYLADTDVTVYARDDNASSGLEGITCILYNSDGSIYNQFTAGSSELNFENGQYSYRFVVPEGFKGNIVSYATDFVKNVSDPESPKGFILENADRHESTSSIEIALPETQYSDINSVPLYSSDITAGITANDVFSGIRKIEWTTTDYQEGTWKTLFIDENGNISGDDANEWSITSSERNLVTGISRNLNVTSNINNNKIIVRLTDNSGNVKQQETVFSIDKTVPVINVSFDNNTPDSKYKDIYKASRTATITVNERNFSSARTNISIHNAAGSQVPGAADFKLVSGTEGTDTAVYQTTVSFFNDGTYSFTADCTDLCSNAAQTYTSDTFIIDKTAPAADVTFDNNNYKNKNFYSGKRTATIKITDNNFDPDRISIHGTYNSKADGFPVPAKWESANGVYTTTVEFKEDGYYTLEISGSDKAGNAVSNPYSASFYIDKQSPSVTFGGVKDKSANNGDVIPTILFTDSNLDTDTAVITMEGAKRGKDLKLQGKFVETDEGYLFTAENFPKEKDTDDIYTITASCQDMAGNSSSGTLTFSVNRFGSNYIFDDSTKAIANKYISQEQDIIIKEINVDELKSDPEITITKDSQSITLSEGTDYMVNHTSKPGEWSEYEYVIFSQNFSDDAAYTVAVYSEDKAGNKNKSLDKSKEAELSFGVDKTAPRCTVLDLDKNGTYKTDSKTVHLSVTDNILINTVDVYLNGSKIDSTLSSNECTFEIKSSKSTQDVKINLTDMAGNITELTLDNILVSTNIARILLHRTWFKIVGGIACVGLIGSGAYVVIKKKKERGF